MFYYDDDTDDQFEDALMDENTTTVHEMVTIAVADLVDAPTEEADFVDFVADKANVLLLVGAASVKHYDPATKAVKFLLTGYEHD